MPVNRCWKREGQREERVVLLPHPSFCSSAAMTPSLPLAGIRVLEVRFPFRSLTFPSFPAHFPTSPPHSLVVSLPVPSLDSYLLTSAPTSSASTVLRAEETLSTFSPGALSRKKSRFPLTLSTND